MHRLLLRFNHMIDSNRALEGCPLSFGKNVLVLSGIREDENSMHVDLSWCDFYVHVHELPLRKMTLGIATFLVTELGNFEIWRWMKRDSTWWATLRIRVTIMSHVHCRGHLNSRQQWERNIWSHSRYSTSASQRGETKKGPAIFDDFGASGQGGQHRKLESGGESV
ncbi:UNVERIFIED_CONTAM: hypothetical protein Sradi_3180700 [Sesamum radiatum]|uniref:Uncharacterized protein n=1 Tax=Sesamum radiatum TaxID=300843 RepID=A0AAW2REZ7_SESRA